MIKKTPGLYLEPGVFCLVFESFIIYYKKINDLTFALRQLPVIERLTIISEIWDEIKESKDLELVSDNEKKLLQKRLNDYRLDKDSAEDWIALKMEAYMNYEKNVKFSIDAANEFRCSIRWYDSRVHGLGLDLLRKWMLRLKELN